MSEHPKLTAALAADNFGAILGIAMRAREAAADGRYCECAEPLLAGADLMCAACLLNNRDQERAAVHRIVDAHDFTPDKRMEFMCAVCTNWEDNPRHHGVGAMGRTSWGESVSGDDCPRLKEDTPDDRTP